MQAYQHLNQLREPDKFAAWLRRLTFNGCTDYRRRHGRPPLLGDEINFQATPTDPGVDRLIIRLAVQEALVRLPERTRLTVILCHLKGYSHEEASRFLSIPINTVRSRLQHAKRQLREEMRDMVAEEVNAGRPDADWTRQVVQEAMTRGRQAREDYKKREAVGHYDAALSAISALPPGKERARLTMDALWQKGSTLDEQRSGSIESIALLEQSLALAEELKDRRGQMEKRIELGRAFYNSGQDENALENYRKAQKIAQEIGDMHTQARCLTNQGIGRLWGDHSEGLALFAQALPLFEESGDLNSTVYCRAVLDVAAELGPGNLSVEFSPEQGFRQPIIGFFAGCDTFRVDGGTVTHQDETCYVGYTWREEMARSPLRLSRIFWQASHLRKLLDAAVPVGGHWSGNAFSNTEQPLKAVVTVLSRSEKVTVPAGTFEGCLLTEQITTEESPLTESNRELVGIVRVWYAPDVGVVQCRIERADGLTATLCLNVYRITETSQGFLPLAVGNRWEYGWMDVPADYAAQEVYEVRTHQEPLWFVEHYAYAYQRRA